MPRNTEKRSEKLEERCRRAKRSDCQFSYSVLSDPFWLHGLQHPRLPCPSQLSESTQTHVHWFRDAHPTISYSAIPFSSSLQSFPELGSFPVSQLFISVAKVLAFQLQHQSFPWIFITDFLSDWVVGYPCSPSDSQESSPKPKLFKSIFLCTQLPL